MNVRDVSDSFDVWARFGSASSSKALEGASFSHLEAIYCAAMQSTCSKRQDAGMPAQSLVHVSLTSEFGPPRAASRPLSIITSADGWPLDPRTPELGQRTILPKSAEAALELPPADQEEYRQWRHSLGIAEGPSEIPPGAHPRPCHILEIT